MAVSLEKKNQELVSKLEVLYEQNEKLIRERKSLSLQLAGLSVSQSPQVMKEIEDMKRSVDFLKCEYATVYELNKKLLQDLKNAELKSQNLQRELLISGKFVESQGLTINQLNDKMNSYKSCIDFLVKNGYKDNLANRDCVIIGLLDDKLPEDFSELPSGKKLECVICLENERKIIFEPCGHFSTCKECSVQVVKCPVCRATVNSKKNVFI